MGWEEHLEMGKTDVDILDFGIFLHCLFWIDVRE